MIKYFGGRQNGCIYLAKIEFDKVAGGTHGVYLIQAVLKLYYQQPGEDTPPLRTTYFDQKTYDAATFDTFEAAWQAVMSLFIQGKEDLQQAMQWTMAQIAAVNECEE